jgi:hypothetical protein
MANECIKMKVHKIRREVDCFVIGEIGRCEE